MVLGGLIAQTVTIPLIWKISQWRPSFSFQKEAFRDLFSFGAHLTGASMINYFARNADNLIIGKFLGATPLGYYSLAYNLMLKPLQYLSGNIGRVLFPTFSTMKDDKERTKNAYLKIIQFISFFTFPMMLGLLYVAPEFIEVVYTTKWIPVVPVLQVLCIIGAIQTIGTTVGTIYMSQARTDLQFKYTLIFTPIIVASFLVGIQWGIIGVALCYLITQSGIWIWSHVIANRLINLKLSIFFAQLLPATYAALGMYVFLSITKYIQYKFNINYGLRFNLIEFIIVGIISYLAITYITKSEVLTEIRNLVKERKGVILNY